MTGDARPNVYTSTKAFLKAGFDPNEGGPLPILFTEQKYFYSEFDLEGTIGAFVDFVSWLKSNTNVDWTLKKNGLNFVQTLDRELASLIQLRKISHEKADEIRQKVEKAIIGKP